MPTMKSVQTAAPGQIEVAEIGRPHAGPRDVLVRIRACGICGTDAAFVQMGGMPLGPGGQMTPIPLGHEPAGEVVAIGAEVTGLKPGDGVVINPQAAPSGIIGCGGAQGGMKADQVRDVSCSGATIASLSAPQPTSDGTNPAQLTALTPAATLSPLASAATTSTGPLYSPGASNWT